MSFLADMSLPEQNEIFSLAAEVVNQTSCNLFLTGKAGTGKTTFLKYIRDNTAKNTAVVAPTGVAAINAGGVTIHSLFQLPFMNFIPDYKTDKDNVSFVNRSSLFRGMRLGREKVDTLNELELLIIDEVSMVRADLLDMIDETLRHFRSSRKPFGGVQVLFIGDMYQLPPVIRETEWKTLSQYYSSPFFFSAKVLEGSPFLFLELKKIYRQSEEKFIRILNNIRNTSCTEEDFKELNRRYSASAERKGIALVTHNYMADKINQEELRKLKTPSSRFSAEVKGVFSESSFPCETELNLKPGARVMFIKNDSSGERRYYNGKLATVKSIEGDEVLVELAETKEEFPLEREKWKNIQYKLNKESGKIEEEEIGSFTQYPVRLAWAVTIHKSQGLTFDEVVIDAGKSFAAGQVYVALSRCRTLDGITLLSPVNASHIITDKQIAEFYKKENRPDDMPEILTEEKRKYASVILTRAFDFKKISRELEKFSESAGEKQLPDKKLAEQTVAGLLKSAGELNAVAEKFVAELEKRFSENPLNEQWLSQKVTGAKKFFVDKIHTGLIGPVNVLQANLKGKKRVRKFSSEVNALEDFLWRKVKSIERAVYGNLSFEVVPAERKTDPVPKARPVRSAGESRTETLNFYKQGMKVAEIAGQRGLTVSTIEGHLAEFVSTGEVNVYDFLDKSLLERIKSAAEESGYGKLSPIKNVLGDEASYGQIKMALSYLKGVSASEKIS